MIAVPGKQNQYCRIVMFLPEKTFTGGGRYLNEVSAYLKRQDLQVESIVLEYPRESRRGISLLVDCLLANFRLFNKARQLGELSNVVFFEDYHFHPRLWLFNMLVRLCSGHLRIVVLMQSALFYHNALRNRWARWLDERVIRSFFQQASLVLTNSEFARHEVLSLGISSNKVQVIYCGYEGFANSDSMETQALGEIQRHILFVGQCTQYKGVEFLLRALPLLSDQEITLDLVGSIDQEPEYVDRVKHLVEELGLQNRVVFHGFVSDKAVLAQFYRRADVFVLPSLIEGFGIVLLDAMSFGLPIVATRVGGVTELVKDGVNGLLVAPADSASLAQAIERLLDSRPLRAQYQQAGYEFTTDHREIYCWEAVGQRALQAMRPLLMLAKENR